MRYFILCLLSLLLAAVVAQGEMPRQDDAQDVAENVASVESMDAPCQGEDETAPDDTREKRQAEMGETRARGAGEGRRTGESRSKSSRGRRSRGCGGRNGFGGGGSVSGLRELLMKMLGGGGSMGMPGGQNGGSQDMDMGF